MALVGEALALAPAAGLRLEIKVEEREGGPTRPFPSPEERARRAAGPSNPKLGPL
jgi:hypothetical protein